MKSQNNSYGQKTNLEKLVHMLGWQGGTIHQVAAEVSRRLKHVFPGGFTTSELIDLNENDLGCVCYLLSKSQGEE